ncbi:MAG: chorismate synthase [Oscillospiraceae bacterium]|nr:chorismate synthase [Oscillospiraceae bacterium]
MGSVWGNRLKISVFGESHGEGIGVVIDGFAAGFEVDFDYINKFLKRRAPGGRLATDRSESDIPEVLSGIKENFTTGAPICAFIRNTNTRSSDYQDNLINPRPSHADFNAYIKYNGYSDQRGGGHFSGRLTAPLVFAGALCSDYLEKKYGVKIGAHIKRVGEITDDDLDLANIDINLADKLKQSEIPMINSEKAEEAGVYIATLKDMGDSAGTIIECFVLNVPAAIGEHMFSSVESNIASCIFGIPAVKGIEFGRGFDFAKMRGSEANDEFYYDDNGKVKTKTNNNGGILGGMSSGMPIVFSVVLKPTSSIFSEQNTINIKNKTNEKFTVKGRHDPCIGLRAVPVVECVTAIALADLLFGLRYEQ